MSPAALHILIALHFVCPLIFFTDLTRNPYITQIALLNIGLLAAAAIHLARQSAAGELRLPKTILDLPIAGWVGICVLSWFAAYLGHLPHFRPAMRSEGLRVFLFMGVNSLLPFYLAVQASRDSPEESDAPIVQWFGFVVIWGLLWTLYPQMRAAPGPLSSIRHHLWDPYGALLWIGGTAVVIFLARKGSIHSIWHVALSVGFLASAYAVVQYFGKEFLWPKVLNPYGGRSVSTFGNPNFMSSYQVMLLPLAVTYYLSAKNRLHRTLYGVIALCLQAGLLCSLTRSSWVGGAAALAPLAFSGRLRRLAKRDVEFHGLVAVGALLLLLFWPQGNVSGYVSSFIGRLTEVAVIFKDGGVPYSPWYQRVLIWTCGWTMGSENPLLGKGWGNFELFYPFYQGFFLDHFEFFRSMRTHANNSHNEVLEIFSQTGILGLGVFAWIWTVFFRGSWLGARPFAYPRAPADPPKKGAKPPPDSERIWILAAAAGVFGMLVDNLLNVSIHFAVPAFFFWWQAGAAVGLLANAENRERVLRMPNKAASWALAAALLLAAGFGCRHFTRYWLREVHYFMGFKLVRGGDLRRAIVELTKAYRWDRHDVNNNYELGNSYARSDQPDKALWAYAEALNANAGYDEIYFNRASVLHKLGRLEEAEKNFLTSWAINPLSPQLYTAFTRFYLSGDLQANRDKAIPLLEQAARLYPHDLNHLNNLGYLYSLGGETAKAEKAYIRVLRRQPSMGVAEKNLRNSIARSGRPAPPVLSQIGAFRALEQGLKSAQAAGFRDRRGSEKLLKQARKVAEWFPDFPAARLYRGNLELLHGDPAAAEKDLRWIVAKEPKKIAPRINLAQAVKAQGRRGEAADLFRAVLALDPGNAQARAELKSLAGR